MFKKVVIVIPSYKSIPDYWEKISIIHNIQVLNQYPIIFIVPENIDTSWYYREISKCSIIRFPKDFFTGFAGYNKLLLSKSFYQAFEIYEKLLICQPDAFVFSDQLQKFCQLPYDYIGAPIGIFRNGHYQLYGGNGGFSLRNVNICKKFLANHLIESVNWTANEDEFFSYYGEEYNHELRIAPINIASKFAFDRYSQLLYEMNNNRLPFAIHGWYARDISFMKSLIMPFISKKIVWPSTSDNKQLINEFFSFINHQKKIALYGAGEWGKIFLQYLNLNRINVECFLISNEQNCNQDIYEGKKILHLSEILSSIQEYGVIITTGRTYRKEIHKNLMKVGTKNIYEISEELCNIVGEIILRAAEENKMYGRY